MMIQYIQHFKKKIRIPAAFLQQHRNVFCILTKKNTNNATHDNNQLHTYLEYCTFDITMLLNKVNRDLLANFSRKRTIFRCTSLTSSTRDASSACSLSSSVSNDFNSSTLHAYNTAHRSVSVTHRLQ